MRRATALVLLGLLAACGLRQGPSSDGAPDAAVEAYQQGDFERAEALLGSRADPESALLKARILLLRHRPRQAAEILLAFTRRRQEVSLETLLYQELALAFLRSDDFAGAARTFQFLSQTAAARKYETLSRRVGYVSEFEGPEASCELLASDPVPLVLADVNSASGLFLVDTALDEVLLDRDFARRARAAAVGLRAGAFERPSDEAVIDSLELGRLRIRNVPARLGTVPAPEGVRADGAIGLSLLMHFDFTLDLGRGRLAFRRPGTPLPRAVPAFWAGERTLLVRGMRKDGSAALAAVASAWPGGLTALPAGGEETDFRLGAVSFSAPRLDPGAFPPGLVGALGFPVNFVLGAGALRGRALRVEPRSMTALVE